MKSGKCPYCEQVLTNLKVESIDIITEPFEPDIKGMSIICPLCRKILHVTFDLLAYKADIATAVADKLKGI